MERNASIATHIAAAAIVLCFIVYVAASHSGLAGYFTGKLGANVTISPLPEARPTLTPLLPGVVMPVVLRPSPTPLPKEIRPGIIIPVPTPPIAPTPAAPIATVPPGVLPPEAAQIREIVEGIVYGFGMWRELLVQQNATTLTGWLSEIKLFVINIGEAPLHNFSVVEVIPPEIAEDPREVAFSPPPDRIEKGSIIAIWYVSFLDVGQQLNFNYTVKKKVEPEQLALYQKPGLYVAPPAPVPLPPGLVPTYCNLGLAELPSMPWLSALFTLAAAVLAWLLFAAHAPFKARFRMLLFIVLFMNALIVVTLLDSCYGLRISIASIVALGIVYFVLRFVVSRPPALYELPDELKELVWRIKWSGGRTDVTALSEVLKMPEEKVNGMLKELEEKKFVKRIKRGKGYVVRLLRSW